MPSPKKPITYADAGVDIDAGNALVEKIKPLAKSTKRPGVMSGLGGFGALFDLKDAGFIDPILVAATDGVGTKLKIAIETGKLDTVGIDLVAMCVNDLICQGAEPLFFLDYFATGKLDIDHATQVIKGIADGCKQANCGLVGGETAEMSGMYMGNDFDLAGFAVGAMERGNDLPKDIQDGDIIIGLPSNGIHSNGYSLVRKIIDTSNLNWNDPAPFNASTVNDETLADSLLTPTKIYVNVAMALHRAKLAKGFAHITGGGLTENIPRLLPEGLGVEINLDTWQLTPIFQWLINAAHLPVNEALKTFNCGIGFVVVCSPNNLDATIKILKDNNEEPILLGTITSLPEVKYSGSLI